jgi:transcriptional regulator with XRE-family HTH domain
MMHGITTWSLPNYWSVANTLGMSITAGEDQAGVREEPAQASIPPDTFGNRIMLARHMRGLSIREAADLCDIGRGAWTNWERGARPIDILDYVDVISERLKVDKVWLRDGGPLAKPSTQRDRRGRRGSPSPIHRYVSGPGTGNPDRHAAPATRRDVTARRPDDNRPAGHPMISPRRSTTDLGWAA